MAGRLSTLMGSRIALNILTKNPNIIAPTIWKIATIHGSENFFYTIQRNQSNMTMKTIPDDRPSKFSFKGLKQHYELYPLVGIIGIAITALVSFIIYFWMSRPELSFSRAEGSFMMDTMDLNNPPHLKILQTYYGDRALPQVAKIYEDMENAKNAPEEAVE